MGAIEAVMSGTVLAKAFSSIPDPRSALRLVGTSKAWCHVLERAAHVAATDVTTCLQGESGTGKEVIARFIHASSPRSHGPFIAINYAALPDQLVESELFGFERGAFTSAQQSKPGQIELARGGVLFLDEITELTPSAQAKLLRVPQERESSVSAAYASSAPTFAWSPRPIGICTKRSRKARSARICITA